MNLGGRQPEWLTRQLPCPAGACGAESSGHDLSPPVEHAGPRAVGQHPGGGTSAQPPSPCEESSCVLSAVPPVLLTGLLLASCSSVSLGTWTSSSAQSPAAGAPAGGRAIAVGAGPQKHYTVQQQPAAGSCHCRYLKGEPLEDPKCTPGAVSEVVTQANLKSTICRKGGYTSGVRPSAYVTGKEKKLNAASYGFTSRMSDAEYDHLLSGVATL